MVLEKINNEQVINWNYLDPIDNRKSFYKKAVVYQTEKYYYFQSYATLMCRLNKETKAVERLSGACSATTTRHLKAFFDDMGVSLTVKDFYKIPLHQEEISNEFVKNFERDYDNLNPKIKEILAKSDVMINSREEAEELMRLSQIFSLLMD